MSTSPPPPPPGSGGSGWSDASGSGAPVPPGPAEAPRSTGGRRLAWIVGGVCGVLLLVVLLVVVIAVVWFFALRQTPTDAVESYLQAWDEQDCQLYEESTSATFRGHDYTCDAWQEEIQEQSEITFEDEIGEATIDAHRATVPVTERMTDDTGTYEAVYDFHVVKANGQWMVDATSTVQEPREL